MGTRGLALLLLLAACQPAASPAAQAGSGTASPAPPEPGGARVGPAAQTGPAADAPAGPRDLGIGVVFFRLGPGDVPPLEERLELRTRPRPDAPVVATFRLSMPASDRWSYEVERTDGPVEPNLVEFEYEESGVPFDSLTADGRWARLVYGTDGAGELLHGWGDLSGGRAAHLLWRDWLPERATYFLDGGSAVLTDAPGGRTVRFPLVRRSEAPPFDYDHHLEVDSVVGDWIRVRVVTPSDACGIEQPAVRDTVAWTRFVGDDGRPLVWLFSRGC